MSLIGSMWISLDGGFRETHQRRVNAGLLPTWSCKYNYMDIFRNILLVRKALGSRDGQGRFFFTGLGGAGQGQTLRGRAVRGRGQNLLGRAHIAYIS